MKLYQPRMVAFNFSFGNLPNFSVRKNGHAHRILCTRLSLEQLLDAQFESVLVDFFQFENWKHGLSPVIPGPNKNKIMQIWLLHVKVQLKIFNHTENYQRLQFFRLPKIYFIPVWSWMQDIRIWWVSMTFDLSDEIDF